MADVIFPTGIPAATPTRDSKVLGDNGLVNQVYTVKDILALLGLADLPPGQVDGDRLVYSVQGGWAIVRARSTPGLNPAQQLADANMFEVNQGGTDNVRTTLGALYTYLLSRMMAQNVTVEEVPGATYTLVAGDKNKVKRFTSTGAVTVSIPSGLPVGFYVSWIQDGPGQITFQSQTAAGQIIQSASGLKSAAQYARGSLLCVANNTWNLSGLTEV